MLTLNQEQYILYKYICNLPNQKPPEQIDVTIYTLEKHLSFIKISMQNWNPVSYCEEWNTWLDTFIFNNVPTVSCGHIRNNYILCSTIWNQIVSNAKLSIGLVVIIKYIITDICLWNLEYLFIITFLRPWARIAMASAGANAMHVVCELT